MTGVIAHRGASAYEPENTMAAFDRAVEMGADGIELDVHATADGRIVVFHDSEIDGDRLGDLTLDTLRARATLPDGHAIPLLPDVLDRVGDRVTMYIEVKTIAPEWDDSILEMIRTSPRPTACQIHSFDHRIVKRLRAADPSVTAGALSSSYPIDPVRQLDDCDAAVFWQNRHHVDADLVETLRAAGKRIITWTVDAPDDVKRMTALGVDAVCTNTPDVARGILS